MMPQEYGGVTFDILICIKSVSNRMDKLLVRLARVSRIKAGTGTSNIFCIVFMPYSKRVGDCAGEITG